MEEYGYDAQLAREAEGSGLMRKVLAGGLIAETWRKNVWFVLLVGGVGM